MIFKKQIFFLVSLFFVQVVIAQVRATIKATVDKKSILIGEPLQLTIEVNLSADFAISFVTIDTIGHFEFLDKPVFDTINEDGGATIRGVYKLTSFDSGHWVIPSFSIFPGLKTDTIPIDVVFSGFDPSQDYHDIKDILAAEEKVQKKKWWLFVLVALLLLTWLVYYLKKRKKPVMAAAPLPINVYSEAMKQLEALRIARPGSRQYFSQLTDIFRLYVFKKKGLLSMQKTTSDLVLQLQGLGLSKPGFDRLAQALRLSDFVKFAKYNPFPEEEETSFTSIKNAIEEIEQLQ